MEGPELAGRRCLGVLGGSGPLATAEFHQRLVRACAARGARADADFPVLLVSSSPVPGMDAAGTLAQDAAAHLLDQALTLTALGAGALAAPCNTVHAQLSDLPLPVPLVDMVEATTAALSGLARVGVLTSRQARQDELYPAALTRRGVAAVTTTAAEQDVLDDAIADLMGGGTPLAAVTSLVAALRGRGAEVVVLGCTELSLLGTLPDTTDALDHLVTACLDLTFSPTPAPTPAPFLAPTGAPLAPASRRDAPAHHHLQGAH